MTWPEVLQNVDQYIVIPLLIAVGAVIAGWAVRVGNAAVAVLEKKAGIELTQQAHDAVKEAAVTSAGIAKTMLDQGALKLEHVTPDNKVIVDLATAAIARVPDSAAVMNKSVASMAETIVGLVDTSPKPTVLVAPVSPILRQ